MRILLGISIATVIALTVWTNLPTQAKQQHDGVSDRRYAGLVARPTEQPEIRCFIPGMGGGVVETNFQLIGHGRPRTNARRKAGIFAVQRCCALSAARLRLTTSSTAIASTTRPAAKAAVCSHG
jgi:hypothetical protein